MIILWILSIYEINFKKKCGSIKFNIKKFIKKIKIGDFGCFKSIYVKNC